MATWYCRPKSAGEKERNPIAGEFFDEEAIERPAQALVREAIQNALDARANGDAVKVRFYISSAKGALPAKRSLRWFEGAWDHFNATDSGLRKRPDLTDSCPFLVVEDFSTIGLEGDPMANDNAPISGTKGSKNHFFAFFRAEGVSENTGGRGTWGVGKTVFARSSGVNALFGLTVRRSDNQRLLMGQATLRFHIVEKKKYTPDIIFGAPQVNDLVPPIIDAAVLDEFCRDCHLRRRKEPGLSVVVPYSDKDITPDAIAKAVAREYFYPILTGRLVVEIESPDERQTLDSYNLLHSITSSDEDMEGDLRSLIELACWAITLPPNQILSLVSPPPEQAPAWSKSCFPDERLEELTAKFTGGSPSQYECPSTCAGHRAICRPHISICFCARIVTVVDIGPCLSGMP